MTASLARCASWRSGVVVALATVLLSLVSVGPMAQSLGGLSVPIWSGMAIVGAIQCLFVAEMGSALRERVGGTATYAQAVMGGRLPLVGAVSMWAYWLGWTPGVAMNLGLASRYLSDSVLPHSPVILIEVLFAIALYTLNARGLSISVAASSVLAVLAAAPILILAVGMAMRPSLVHVSRLFVAGGPAHQGTVPADARSIVKWAFVTAWTAYGAEMASTVSGELRRPERDIPRALVVGAALGVLGFTLVPVLLIVAGNASASDDPLASLLPAASVVLGAPGAHVVGVMLAASLVLGAEAFIIGSSRTVYQLARDRHLPRALTRLNRRGVPTGSMLLDATVLTVLVAIFGTDLVGIMAAANVGYILVFVLLPIAFITLRLRGTAAHPPFRLGGPFPAIAGLIAAINLTLLVWGGAQWGARPMLTGLGITCAIVPVSIACRRRRVGMVHRAPVAPAGLANTMQPAARYATSATMFDRSGNQRQRRR